MGRTGKRTGRTSGRHARRIKHRANLYRFWRSDRRSARKPRNIELALTVLGDATRTFASTEFVRLEVLPKAIYHDKISEVEFYRQYFEAVSCWASDLTALVSAAADLAGLFGLAAMDALHIAAAINAGAEEFVTAEKPSKPLHRVTGLRVITIYPA